MCPFQSLIGIFHPGIVYIVYMDAHLHLDIDQWDIVCSCLALHIPRWYIVVGVAQQLTSIDTRKECTFVVIKLG
jgi:hypothetical protein